MPCLNYANSKELSHNVCWNINLNIDLFFPLRVFTRMTTNQEQKRLERNTKIIKMLVSVVLTYAICLLPNQVVWMWFDFGTGSKYQHFNELLTFCNIMVYINSSTNPILYAGMNEEFRKGFVRILRCNTRTNQGKSFVWSNGCF